MRIGLFGGSFDPFHLGHFLIARTAVESFGLQKVIFLPCAQSPLKKNRPVASDQARVGMLKQGLRGQAWAEVSDWEIRRGGVSYTVDTVNAMARKFPGRDLIWIMGSDQWRLLPAWKDPKELGRKLRFLVFPRPQRPRARRGFCMREIPLRLDISATEIRKRIRKAKTIEGLVLPPVEALIRRQRWYR